MRISSGSDGPTSAAEPSQEHLSKPFPPHKREEGGYEVSAKSKRTGTLQYTRPRPWRGFRSVRELEDRAERSADRRHEQDHRESTHRARFLQRARGRLLRPGADD